MRRVALVVTGLLLAFLAGAILLSVALVRELASMPAATGRSVLDTLAVVLATTGDHPGLMVAAGLWGAWLALVGLCFVPVALVGLLGEAARLRSLPWYAAGSGAVAAALPTLARALIGPLADLRASPAEARLTLIFFLTGIATGSIYWAIAGRHAGAA